MPLNLKLQSSQGTKERKKHLDICVNSYLGEVLKFILNIPGRNEKEFERRPFLDSWPHGTRKKSMTYIPEINPPVTNGRDIWRLFSEPFETKTVSIVCFVFFS